MSTSQNAAPSAPQTEATPVSASELVSLEMPPVTGAPAVNAAKNGTAPVATDTATTAVNTTPTAANAANVETDSAGVPFDPLRHLLKKHPRTGRWMPRKHRKTSQNTANSAPTAPQQPSYIPREPPAPKPESGTDAANASGPNAANTTLQPTGTPQTAPPVASPESVAEVASNAMYAVTGALIKDHKAARPSAAEHANIKKVGAAYIASKGLAIAGFAAVCITIVAYLLGEERREVVFARIKTACGALFKKQPKTVQPVTTPANAAAPASQPAAPVAPTAPIVQATPVFQPLNFQP